ncbi:MAG: hypothetical protein ACI9N1_003251 [Flavobacteriales bacterium]|jgi:hypothetical protein
MLFTSTLEEWISTYKQRWIKSILQNSQMKINLDITNKIFFVVIMILNISSFGQHTFDLRLNEDLTSSVGYTLIETDQHYICLGAKGDFGPYDTVSPMFFVTDKAGNTINNVTYKNDACEFGIASYVSASDDGYIGIGVSRSAGDVCGVFPTPPAVNPRTYLHRIDAVGNLIWSKNMGGTLSDSNLIRLSSIKNSNDGNFLTYGDKNFKSYLLKIDNLGDTIWSKSFNDLNYDKNRIALYHHENGFICLNYDYNTTQSEAIKIDQLGNIEWTKQFYFRYHGITRNKVNQFVTVYSEGNGPGDTITITKYSTSFDEEFSIDISTKINSNDLWTGRSIFETSDGNFVTAYKDIVKISVSGEILWHKNYLTNPYSYYNHMIETSDGGYLLTGRNGNPFTTILTKLDCEGNLEWTNQNCLIPSEDKVILFPNPVFDEAMIQIENLHLDDNIQLFVFNSIGQSIKADFTQHETGILLKTWTFAKGVYVFNILVNDTKIHTGKFVKE